LSCGLSVGQQNKSRRALTQFEKEYNMQDIDIRDKYGTIVFKIRGTDIMDTYGNRRFMIRGNDIYDTYGTRKYEIRGSDLYDTYGSRLGEFEKIGDLLK